MQALLDGPRVIDGLVEALSPSLHKIVKTPEPLGNLLTPRLLILGPHSVLETDPDYLSVGCYQAEVRIWLPLLKKVVSAEVYIEDDNLPLHVRVGGRAIIIPAEQSVL